MTVPMPTPPAPGHRCSKVLSEEGTISGDRVRAAVGLGTNPTHPTGAFGFPGHVVQLGESWRVSCEP